MRHGALPDRHDRVRLRLPFDPEKGTLYIRETLRILDSLNIPMAEREAIDHGTLEKICGVKLVK